MRDHPIPVAASRGRARSMRSNSRPEPAISYDDQQPVRDYDVVTGIVPGLETPRPRQAVAPFSVLPASVVARSRMDCVPFPDVPRKEAYIAADRDDTQSLVSCVSDVSVVTSMSNMTVATGAAYFEEKRKRGVKGRPLPVITNYVAMEKRSNFTIRQYRVDFCPPEDNTLMKKQLLAVHTEALGAYTFDGAMLYKTQELPPESLVLRAQFANSQPHTITLRHVGNISRDHKQFIQFYNTVLRKCLNLMEFEELGRHFYDRVERVIVEGAPLELWPGYITAIKNHDAGVLLCLEATHKVLRITSVLDLIRDVLAKNKDIARGQEAIRKELVGQIIITHYNKKTYKIDDVDFHSTPAAVFQTRGTAKEGPTQVTYQQYYKNRYAITIPDTDMSQPLLVSNPRKKDLNKGIDTNIYLIPSLCNLTGLSDDHRKDYRLMQKMADHLHMDPSKRKQKLEEFMVRMKSNETVSKEFSNWDIEFNPEFLAATARILKPEEIQLQTKDGLDTFVLPEREHLADWTTPLKRHFMLQRNDLSDWLLYIPDSKQAGRLLQGLREQAQLLGMTVLQPLETVTYDTRNKIQEDELLQPLVNWKGKVKFVIFVLPNNQLQRYAMVKKFFVLRHGIAMQCLLSKNLDNKNFNSIMSKMAIQINAKLGGVPWSVKVPFKTRVMILGYDVYHCAERKKESVGALVSTVSPNLGKYFSVVSFHADKSELSRNMCLDTKKCLEAFKEANGAYPDRILLYRDGVGEGQIEFVMDHEVKMMQEGINEVYGAAGLKNPYFTFTVVTKKINSRFMTTQGPKVVNPPPGTVLDEVMTIPGRFDFFIISQSVRQGTVSPTNYNVIYDNSGVSADSMQQITFKLCHLYYNWSGTVAVPAPCQFAHKLAYLTGVALSDKVPDNLSNVLWYL